MDGRERGYELFKKDAGGGNEDTQKSSTTTTKKKNTIHDNHDSIRPTQYSLTHRRQSIVQKQTMPKSSENNFPKKKRKQRESERSSSDEDDGSEPGNDIIAAAPDDDIVGNQSQSQQQQRPTIDDKNDADNDDNGIITAIPFSSLNLHPTLLSSIASLKWEFATQIQASSLTSALQGRDVIGLAETGSGKTGAFAIPVLNYLLEKPQKSVFAVILAPTRELAVQIHEVMVALGRGMGK